MRRGEKKGSKEQKKKREKKQKISLPYLRGVLIGRTVRAGGGSQLAHAIGEARNACSDVRVFLRFFRNKKREKS